MKTHERGRTGGTRARRSARVRRELIEAYRRSGLGMAAFCRSHRLPLATLCNWLRRVPAPCAFAEVQVRPGAPTAAIVPVAAAVEIVLPGGVEMRIRDPGVLPGLFSFLRELARC
jgi:hypothetical protein